MQDGIMSEIRRVEDKIGPHPDMAAFLTVRDAVRATEGSDAARAYHGSAPVTLYSAEGHEYTIGFDSLLDELLLLAAVDVGQGLTDEARD